MTEAADADTVIACVLPVSRTHARQFWRFMRSDCLRARTCEELWLRLRHVSRAMDTPHFEGQARRSTASSEIRNGSDKRLEVGNALGGLLG